MLKNSLLWVILLVSGTLSAQDSMIVLPVRPALVQSTRLALESVGSTVYRSDSTSDNHQTVGDFLGVISPISFKQYGPGMLQSASARGTGAGHLGVLWNGINIQSMTHGQVDFALVDMGESVTYISGGNSAMDGSGSLGGMVRLDTRMTHQKGFHGSLSGQLASFSNKRLAAKINYSASRWASLTQISYGAGKNDFPFINDASVHRPLVRQVNNAFQIFQFRQSNQWTINPKNILKFHYWWTDANRQIPPSKTSTNDHARQIDRAHRMVTEWVYAPRQRLNLRTKLAHITEQLSFQNDGLNSYTATSKQVLDSRLSLKKGQHLGLIGLSGQLERAYSTGYANRHQRWTNALSAADQIQLAQSIIVSVQGRLEWKDFGPVIPIFNVGGEWVLLSQNTNPMLRLKTKFGRHFHAPTFNDLFWQGLGKPDLKDETGYQGEITLQLDHQPAHQKYHLLASLTAFRLNITNWILWTPDPTGVWHPANSKKVQSGGIESQFTYSFLRKPFQTQFHASYTFVKSVNKESQNPKAINKQLLYVPKHKANTLLRLSYHNINLLYQSIWVGKRPYTADNSQSIPPYWTHDVHLGYRWKLKKIRYNFDLGATNFTDVHYELIRLRPMPGIGFMGRIRLLF